MLYASVLALGPRVHFLFISYLFIRGTGYCTQGLLSVRQALYSPNELQSQPETMALGEINSKVLELTHSTEMHPRL